MKKRRLFAIIDNRSFDLGSREAGSLAQSLPRACRGDKFRQGLLIASAILLTSVSQGQEWTRFRGPNGQGIPVFSCESKKADTIPIKWRDADYNWKVTLPGAGHSSPVLWKDKVFITSGDQKDARGILLALQVSDGKVLWQREYTLPAYRMNKQNSYAAATPAVDADHIYTLWPTWAARRSSLVARVTGHGRRVTYLWVARRSSLVARVTGHGRRVTYLQAARRLSLKTSSILDIRYSILDTSEHRASSIQHPGSSQLIVRPARHAGNWTEKLAPKPPTRHPVFTHWQQAQHS